jgi:carbon-monoxide dehydrogenase medium subunit
MKPPAFDYVRASTIEEALSALQTFGGDARLLAGGQSLMPLLNMRLLRPAGIIDMNRIPGLDFIRLADGEVRIGALTRYATIEGSAVVDDTLPLVAEAVRRVGDRQVRNRGTLGGSLCHAEPAAQMPLCAVTLGARMLVAGPNGRRVIPAEQFFHFPYTTDLDPLEMLLEIVYPDCRGRLSALEQHIRRHGDFAVVSVAVSGVPDDADGWRDIRIGLGGLQDHPVLAPVLSEFLKGKALEPEVIAEAAALVLDTIEPQSDVRASAEYRQVLAPIYVERALTKLQHAREAVL